MGPSSPPVTYAVGGNPTAIVAGDFNGDGITLDLAVASYGSVVMGTVSVLLGNGDGTFQPAGHLPARAAYPTAMVAGDFNGDGNLDLAVANGSDAGTRRRSRSCWATVMGRSSPQPTHASAGRPGPSWRATSTATAT